MDGKIVGRKQTVLFFRSSPLRHCLPLLNQLREGEYPDPATHWIVVVQPAVEQELQRVLQGTDAEIWTYDHPQFAYPRLMESFGERIRLKNPFAAVVPFNNPEGKGYFDLIRFLTACRIPAIKVFPIEGEHFRITLAGYVLRLTTDRILWAFETLILVVILPFLAVYYLFRSIFARLRHAVESWSQKS